MFELIIIGGGPSGLTAAVYAARKKINTLLISKDIGGQVVTTNGIENYMGYQLIQGMDLMDKFEAQIKQFPIERKIGEEVESVSRINGGFEIKTREGIKYQAKSVIVATGKTPRKLNVPGESRLLGRGISYCSICDGPLFEGEEVAVIGGGNSALEAIDDLEKIASRVYSVIDTNYTGDAVLIDRVRARSNLSVFEGYVVTEITGNETVAGISIQNLKSGERKTLEVKGVFVEVGLTPNSDLVKRIVQLNSIQEIDVNCRSETRVPGLFAAGDVASTPEKQIIVAAGDGAKAALEANRYLQRLVRMPGSGSGNWDFEI